MPVSFSCPFASGRRLMIGSITRWRATTELFRWLIFYTESAAVDTFKVSDARPKIGRTRETFFDCWLGQQNKIVEPKDIIKVVCHKKENKYHTELCHKNLRSSLS